MLNVLQGTLGIYLQYLLERKGARMRDYCRAKWIITAERLITSVIILDKANSSSIVPQISLLLYSTIFI
jgi:hypothetical protein